MVAHLALLAGFLCAGKMAVIKLLADRYDHRGVVDEYATEWLFRLLESLGLDIEVLQDAAGDITMDYLIENQVEVMDYPDIGAIKITKDGDVVGEWAGPSFDLKKDASSGGLYYEITLESWTIFDNEGDGE